MSESTDTAQRLSDLESRVRVLERRLAMRSVVEREESSDVGAAAPPEQSAPIAPLSPVWRPSATPVAAIRPPVWSVASTLLAPRPAKSALEIERTIGTRWFAAIGAVVVVIGVGLFFRLAYQQGWLNLMPPAGKCVLGAAFGAALLMAGEVIRRKLGALASAGASAAGLGALFAAAYAAHGVYHLVPAPAAFAMLACCAALGFAVAARGRLVSIGVLSLLAAYMNPLIIGEASAGPLVLPAYVFALLGAALALSAWRAAPFRPLRSVAWWGTLAYGAWWCADAGLNYPGAALTFLGAVWAVVHAELALGARNPAIAAPATSHEAEAFWNRARFIATSLSTTAWTTAMAINVLREGAHVADWWPPAIIAILAAALAMRLAGSLRILRDVPRTDLERLGAGLAMQAGGLLMTAVALALSGWLEVVAWLSLGLAAAGAGRWIRSRGLDVYGLIALAIATTRLITYDSPFMTAQRWEIDLGGVVLTRWAMLMSLGAAAWVVASRLIRPGDGPRDADQHQGLGWRGLGIASLVVGLGHLNLALIHPRADVGSVCVAWLVLGLAGILLSRVMGSRALIAYGIVALAAASIRFMLAAPVTGGTSGVLFEGLGLVVTRWTVLMVAGGVAWLLAAALVRDIRPRPDPSAPAPAQLGMRAALVGIALAMIFASILNPRVHAASIFYAWVALATATTMGHTFFRRVALDCYGLAGIGAAVMAWSAAYPLDWMSRVSLAPHPGLVGAVVIAVLAVGLGAWLRSPRNPGRPTKPALLQAIGPGVTMLLLAATSLEVARIAGVLSSEPTARRAAVSIWWGTVAVGLIGGGFWRRAALARHAGLALLFVATAKAAIFDLAFVPQTWRVASFIGLGLLMLGVAVGYARVSARLGRPAETLK